MGNFLSAGAALKDAVDENLHFVGSKKVIQYVRNGGCLTEFMTAMDKCNPDYMKQQCPELFTEQERAPTPVNKEACIKATVALRECFASKPVMFKEYLRRIDEGLDQDLKPSPAQIKKEWASEYRWWTGLRRS